MPFDTDAYLAATPDKPAFDPTAYLKGESSPALPSGDLGKYYSGFDSMDSWATPQQQVAFKNLDRVSENPVLARKAVINKTYYESLLKTMPSGAFSSAWDTTTRNMIGKQVFGQVGDTSEEQLFSLTQQHVTDTAYMQKSAFVHGTPWDRMKMAVEENPSLQKTMRQSMGGPAAAVISPTTPYQKLPEAPHVNLPSLGPYNPALLFGVWNSVAKPILESVETPLGVTAMAAGGELAGPAKEGSMVARTALMAMNGYFAALMGKAAYDNTPAMLKVMTDPNATLQDQIEAVGSVITPGLGAIAGTLGAVASVRPDVFKSLTGNPTEDAATLSEEAAKAPLAEAESLNAAAREVSAVAEPPKLSEAKMAWDEVKRVFSPMSRGLKAEETAHALREHGGELARRTNQAEAALNSSSKVLMKMPEAERWDVVHQIETGQAENLPPELRNFAEATRFILDGKREEIQALGTGKLEHFIEDYFPHIWKDPEAAATAFQKAQARAPLEGAKSFLKQRTIPTIQEGMAYGLQPVTSDPVEMVMLRAREMDKYILAQKWLAEMKGKEFVQYVPSGRVPPSGYEPINDRIATVYGKPSHPGAMQIEGKYYAPSEVATVANNYLSPGLRRFASYRGYLAVANSLNQFQLGFSAFHLGFTTLDTSISKLALGMEYAMEGRPIKAAKAAMQVPTSVVTTFLEGNKFLKEWYEPGSQGAEMGKIVDAAMKGGARARMDAMYRTTVTKRMMEMFRQGGVGGTYGGVWRAPFAAMEQISKPLMEYLVPRQKAGVVVDMIRKELAKVGPEAGVDDIRKVAASVVDSVDNRMGQMVYDNLFWNRTLKDLSQATVRSVGWDLGTIREIGGGGVDTARYLKDAMTPGEKAKFTHRMAYTIALPVFTGIIGATWQYLKTGEGPGELRDYFFPKTGEKDPQGRDIRMTLPTYMKDIYHYAHAPFKTAVGKLHPLISTVGEMLMNEDYFGREIRHADDPIVKQMQDEVKFFLSTFEPMGIRQSAQMARAGGTTAERAAAFAGVTRAPAWVGESTAEQLAGKLAGDKFKSSVSPDAEKVAAKQKIQLALRSGNEEARSAAEAQLDQMVEAGEMTSVQRRNLERGTEHTYLENALTHLDAKEAMRVYQVATPAERETIEEEMQKKIDRAHLPSADREGLQAKFDKLSVRRDVNTTLR